MSKEVASSASTDMRPCSCLARFNIRFVVPSPFQLETGHRPSSNRRLWLPHESSFMQSIALIYRYTGYVQGLGETYKKTPIMAQLETKAPAAESFLHTRTASAPKAAPMRDPCNFPENFKKAEPDNLWPTLQTRAVQVSACLNTGSCRQQWASRKPAWQGSMMLAAACYLARSAANDFGAAAKTPVAAA